MFNINFHKFNLRNKIITIIILTFIAMGGITLFLLYPNILNPLLDKQIATNKDYFQNLSSDIKTQYKNGYYAIDKYISSKDHRTFVVRLQSDSNSIIVADNRYDSNLEGKNIFKDSSILSLHFTKTIKKARLNTIYSKILNVNGIRYIVNYYKFLSPDVYNDTMVIISICKTENVFQSVNTIFVKVLSIIAIYSIFIIFILILFIDYLLNPLNELKNGLLELNKGKLGYKININSGDELQNIGSSFNAMSKSLLEEDIRKKEFIQNASHELKTPIAGIKTMSQLIMLNCTDKENMEYLSDINHEVDRLNDVISDLLVLEEIQSAEILNKRTVLSSDFIMEATSNLKRLANKKNIVLEYDLESFSIQLDTLKFERVIINLVDNAIKYSDPDTKIFISCKNQKNYAVIKIKDNGIGIPKDSISHIFTRFYRVDKARSRKTGGTGLGLSIVKEIVELHNGTISVDSQENNGTTFTIQVPFEEVKGETAYE